MYNRKKVKEKNVPTDGYITAGEINREPAINTALNTKVDKLGVSTDKCVVLLTSY